MSKHCCLIMDKLIDEHYLDPTITFSTDGLKVLPPHIPGAKLTEHGRKRRPGFIINFCPGCGKQLQEHMVHADTAQAEQETRHER